jgi:hypothetical protein
MDIFAHSLWSLIVFFRHPLKWWAVFLGVFPDIATFLPHFIVDHMFKGGQSTFNLVYQYTHSIPIFLVVVGVTFLLFKKKAIVFGAWGLHIILDIFTHPKEYYATPYLYPFNSPFLFAFDYRSISFLVVNYLLIVSVLGYLIYKYKK